MFSCLLSFFLGGRDRTGIFYGRNGQRKFQIPLADRANQVLTLVLLLFFTSFKSYDFSKFVNIPIAIL